MLIVEEEGKLKGTGSLMESKSLDRTPREATFFQPTHPLKMNSIINSNFIKHRGREKNNNKKFGIKR